MIDAVCLDERCLCIIHMWRYGVCVLCSRIDDDGNGILHDLTVDLTKWNLIKSESKNGMETERGSEERRELSIRPF